MKFPSHIEMHITHNGHAGNYETIRQYMTKDWGDGPMYDVKEIEACVAADEIWEMQWYPTTPIGFFRIASPTLETLLERANATHR